VSEHHAPTELGHENHLTVYGATWCSDCKRAKKFLGEQRIHYDWVDVEANADGLALVERVSQGKRIIPTIVFEDGSNLVEPSNAELASKLGLQTRGQRSRRGRHRGADDSRVSENGVS
jgi:glutaredoxin-like protein